MSHNTNNSSYFEESSSNNLENSEEAHAVELKVVRHRPSSGGRPLFLTPRRFVRICEWIEQGESAVEACRRELVTYSGFRRHIQRNPKYAFRLKEAEAVRESFLREFHVNNVMKHAPKTILASLWWLERRFPADFALRAVTRDQPMGEKVIGSAIDEVTLRRYAELTDKFNKENEARKAAQALVESSDLEISPR